MINFFGLETEPLAAPRLFSIGPIPVTNAQLFAIITALVLILTLMAAARYSQLHPKSYLAYLMELLVDFIWGIAIDTFGDRRTALKHLPLLGTLFIFILIGNLSGGLPKLRPASGKPTGAELRARSEK